MLSMCEEVSDIQHLSNCIKSLNELLIVSEYQYESVSPIIF